MQQIRRMCGKVSHSFAENMENKSELIHALALTKLAGVGAITARKLINCAGSAEAVFRLSKNELMCLPGVTAKLANKITSGKTMEDAENQIERISSDGHEIIYYQDERYPQRLTFCEDRPLMLFFQGTTNFNLNRVLAVVGTRDATRHGLRMVDQLLEEISPFQPLIVSGLAYGIDIAAHRKCLDVGLPTVGVMGTGLDGMYPSSHRGIADMMKKTGGLLTEFEYDTKPDRENFPKRNRIVAGMTDAVIVVESTRKGGSLITAEIAASYGREVFAFPGKATDELSTGCNWLIKTQRASMVESGRDIAYQLGWNTSAPVEREVKPLPDLDELELSIVQLLKTDELEIDQIGNRLEIPGSKATIKLLELEFKGIIASLPGKKYRLI